MHAMAAVALFSDLKAAIANDVVDSVLGCMLTDGALEKVANASHGRTASAICVGCFRINGVIRRVMSAHGASIDANPHFGTCDATDTDINTNVGRKMNGCVGALPIAVIAGHALCALPLCAAGETRLGSCGVAGLRSRVRRIARRGGMVESAFRFTVCVLKRLFLSASEFSTDFCDAMLV